MVDNAFYKMMNNNFSQVVMYMQTVFMLANEIIKNIEWENEHRKKHLFVKGKCFN